ncbi:hypothetical protein HKD37_13G038263 [Glycine soja]
MHTLTKHKPPNPLISVLAAGRRASGDWILEIATVRRIARSYFFAAPPLVAATRRRPHRLWWALTQTIRLLPCDLNIIDSNPSPCPIRGVSCIERERRRQQREATIANSST